MNKKTALLTAILFHAGEPVARDDLARWAGIDDLDLEEAFREMEEKAAQGGPLTMIRLGDKFQLTTNPVYAEKLQSIFNPPTEAPLSDALLETLTLIAYRQPITRPEIERVRGVRAVYAVTALLERGLICKTGSKPVIGNPALYATTDEFLRQFGLSSLSDLPPLDPETEQLAQAVLHLEADDGQTGAHDEEVIHKDSYPQEDEE